MATLLRIAGSAVEAPDHLWHLNRDAGTTFCGRDCSTWPSVPDAAERFGIWCGRCLHAAVPEERG